MSTRDFTLLIDDRTGRLSVQQHDGTVTPLDQYRLTHGF
jgi:hypothetical protein